MEKFSYKLIQDRNFFDSLLYSYAPDELIRGGICSPSKHALDEIRNSMFLPLMKKALLGGIGADTKTILSLVILRYPALLFSVMPQGQYFLESGPLMKIFLPSINNEIESAPDKKKSWTRICLYH